MTSSERFETADRRGVDLGAGREELPANLVVRSQRVRAGPPGPIMDT